jgi:hypothetical protein
MQLFLGGRPLEADAGTLMLGAAFGVTAYSTLLLSVAYLGLLVAARYAVRRASAEGDARSGSTRSSEPGA